MTTRDHEVDSTLPRDERSAGPGAGPGPGPGPSGTEARDPDVVQDLDEHGSIIALAAGEHDRQRHPIPINGGMNLAAQPAA